MLTPRFKLSQDHNHVFITVHAPYTNIGDTEIDVDGQNFLFVSSPYFLRLCLPGAIVDNDSSKGSYVCDSGDFNLTFDKEVPGEHFENLDMITSLLAPRDIPDMNPDLVEMLEEDGITLEDEPEDDNGNEKYTYGFANKVTTEFSNIGVEFPQIFELKVPENVEIKERQAMRIKHENLKFSAEHYLADFYDDELLEPYLTAIPYWDAPDFPKVIEFSDDEVGVLKELPNKHYLLSKTEYKQVMMGLVDILYGYCYDKRTTLNESTVESSWTINKLSSTLSWFCTFNDINQILQACYRRALIYPIFRNYELCIKVKNDLVSLFKKGKKFVLKCMVEIHQMFNSSNDARFILNQLYIKDYLVFLQKVRNEELDEICNNIANIDISKKNTGLNLNKLEETAESLGMGDVDIMENEVAVRMASLSLVPDLKKNSPVYYESDEETDSSSGSSDSSSGSSDSSSGSSDSSSDSDDDSSDELDSDDDPS